MRIRIKVRASEPGGDQYTPFGLLPARRGLWISLSWSLCAHGCGLWAGLTLFNFPPVLVTEYVPLVRKDRVISLDVSPPEVRQVVVAASSSKAAGPVTNRSRAAAQPAATAAKPAAGAMASALPALATKQFRMPEQYVLQPLPQTLVQLDIPPTLDLHQQLRVPALVILTDASVRRAPLKPFVAPPPKTADVPMDVALDMQAGVCKNDGRIETFEHQPAIAGWYQRARGRPAAFRQQQTSCERGRKESIRGRKYRIPARSSHTVSLGNCLAACEPGCIVAGRHARIAGWTRRNRRQC